MENYYQTNENRNYGTRRVSPENKCGAGTQSQLLPLELELTFCRREKEEKQTAKEMGLLMRVKLGREDFQML